jgi:ABC-2 type transport system permease protein
MRHTYLIARREYLSYVATPGFWLSLAMVPVFMLLGIAVPVLLERSTPTRYFSVVDPDGRYEQVIAERLSGDRADQVRMILETLSSIPLQEDEAKQALAALDAGQSIDSVVDGLSQQTRTALAAIKESYVLVSPPAQTEQELKPYLLGDKKIDIGGEGKALYAVAFIKNTEDGGVSIDYWSKAITAERLKGRIRRAVRDEMRTEAFAKAGLETEIVRSINAMQPKVATLSPEKADGEAVVTSRDRAPFFAAIMFAFILWMIVFSVANMLLTSTIEEKSGKVLDSLLSAAPVRSLLSGKLLGVAAVSFTLLAGWAIAGAVATSIGTQFLPAGGNSNVSSMIGAVLNPGLILPFLGYFVFGYLMFGSIFLALGSLCETVQEAQTLMSPIIFTLMIPMFALSFALQEPNSPILAVISWIPLFTPYIMLARLPADPPLFDVIGTTLLMIFTTLIVLWAAGRVFRAGAMHGAGVDYFKRLIGLGKKSKKNKTAKA